MLRFTESVISTRKFYDTLDKELSMLISDYEQDDDFDYTLLLSYLEKLFNLMDRYGVSYYPGNIVKANGHLEVVVRRYL